MSYSALSRGPGWVLCCICFKQHNKPFPDLYVDAKGDMWDFCKKCAPLTLPIEPLQVEQNG